MKAFHKIKVCEKKEKYGESSKTMVAVERIFPGELIRYCVCGVDDKMFTKEQLLNLGKKNPKLKCFLGSMTYMIDDDIYKIPAGFLKYQINDECSYFNHSCDPNIGFDPDAHGYLALRVIEPGEEVLFHYGFLETEQSLAYGLECKCGGKNCERILKFENYRDDEFAQKYYDYFTPYMKQKVRDMKERWYSSSCYVKRVPTTEKNNIQEWKTCLCSYKNIKKHDLVAKFSSYDKIHEKGHFIRHSKTPNCYLKDKNVYASVDVPAETELTLFFN